MAFRGFVSTIPPFCGLLLLWLLLLLPNRHLVRGEGYPLHEQSFVYKLTDATFEHETQASTGGTTGSWLVWFHDSDDQTPIEGTVPEPEFWTENHVVLATVDTRLHGTTAHRFDISQVPILLFLHKGKYYVVDEKTTITTETIGSISYEWSMIQAFVTEGFATRKAHDIPPPRTALDEMIEMIQVMFREKAAASPPLPYLIVVSFLAVAGFIGILSFFFARPKEKKKAL